MVAISPLFTLATGIADVPEATGLSFKGHCIEFKYYADGILSGLTPPV